MSLSRKERDQLAEVIQRENEMVLKVGRMVRNAVSPHLKYCVRFTAKPPRPVFSYHTRPSAILQEVSTYAGYKPSGGEQGIPVAITLLLCHNR